MVGLIVPAMMTNPDLTSPFLALTGRERGGLRNSGCRIVVFLPTRPVMILPQLERNTVPQMHAPEGKL